MKLLVILLITWVDGSQSGFELEPTYSCNQAMDDAIALADDVGFEHVRMECIYTDQIIVSPLPMRRPVGLGLNGRREAETKMAGGN